MEPDELRALAARKPVRSHDLHPFNGFYGHDAVLKAYAGLPERTVAKLAVEHGVDLTGLVADVDRHLVLPVHLCSSERRAAEVARALPRVRAVAIGLPILYARALAGPPGTPPARRAVLFPAHSAETVRADYDVASLLARCATHLAGFEETVACLYWRDVQLGRDEEYRRAGVACTTAGHLLDPRFLFRLLEILEGAAAVITNEPGTHVAYAVALGKPVWIVPEPVSYCAGRGVPRDQRAAVEALACDAGPRVDLQRAFAEPVAAPTPEQQALVAALAGRGPLPPAELAALFAEAEERFRATTTRSRRVVLRLRAESRRLRR